MSTVAPRRLKAIPLQRGVCACMLPLFSVMTYRLHYCIRLACSLLSQLFGTLSCGATLPCSLCHGDKSVAGASGSRGRVLQCSPDRSDVCCCLCWQDCNLYTSEGLRGKEMAESSDAIRQMVKCGLVPSSSTVSLHSILSSMSSIFPQPSKTSKTLFSLSKTTNTDCTCPTAIMQQCRFVRLLQAPT